MSCSKNTYAPFPDNCDYIPEILPTCQNKECVHFSYKLYDLLNIERPLVSVIMPYYNKKKTVQNAVHSIVSQTYDNWELILVDDGSEDEGAIDMFSFLNEHDLACVYEWQENHGQAHARNTGFCKSSGMFIAYLDPDDMWMPDHLEKALSKILDEQCQFVYGHFNHLFHDGLNVIDEVEHTYPEGIVGNEKEALQFDNFISLNTVVHDRRLFVVAGGFEEGVICGEDGLLWRRMADVGAKFGFVEEPTAWYCKYKNLPGYHQSVVLKEPEEIKGVHLIGNHTNGQELDIQETYKKRVEKLKEFAEPKSKKIDYIRLG